MRAVAHLGGGRLGVVDRPDPEPGPGEVVVAVERCGICGSDLHLAASLLLPPGAVLGHELAGRVAAVGTDVTNVREGARVAVLPMARCGTCDACRAGRTQLCFDQARTALGLGVNDGGFAELVRTDASACFAMPSTMTSEQGALVEPYAVGLHAVRRSRVLADAARAGATADVSIGVLGAGPIGLMTLAALRAEGFTRVAVAEPGDARAGVAARLGATEVVADGTQLTRALDRPPDVVFECAGTPSTPQVAVNEVRPGGEVVLVGVADPTELLSLLWVLLVVKEVDVRPSIAYTTDEYAESVAAVAAGGLDAAGLVSDVRPLDAADASFTELRGGRGPVKVLLAP
jgi:(R,R)-butanediol dehydrogenase/meso-butanediol dehydrogenase/diacetyl reductase